MGMVFEQLGTITADDNWEFPDAQDLSPYWQLGGSVTLTGNAVGGGGITLDVTLQSRDQSGIWVPRWRCGQLNGADTTGEGFILDGLFQQTLLSAAYQSGANNAALAAGEVRNGFFPPVYFDTLVNYGAQPGNKKPSYAWRWNFDQTGVGSFPLRVCLYGVGPMERQA